MLWLIMIVCGLALLYIWLIHPNASRRGFGDLAKVDYAHRGLWNTNEPGAENRPENSLAAFRAAVEKGYGIELDVHQTSDGHLVVHHDDWLTRLTGTGIQIAKSTLDEVRACHLPNGEMVPTFDEVLDVVAGRVPLLVEVKVEGNAQVLSQAVYERMKQYDGPWCMESFDPWAVRWYRQHAPEIVRGQLACNTLGKGKTMREWWRNAGMSSMMQNALSRPDFVAFGYGSEGKWNIPMYLLRWMRTSLAAWTVRSQKEMDALRTRYDVQIFEHFEAKH